MTVEFGKGKTEYGPGVEITLSGDDVAMAIYTYLVAHRIIIDGAATIKVNGKPCESGSVYVAPSGNVIFEGIGYSGRGKKF